MTWRAGQLLGRCLAALRPPRDLGSAGAEVFGFSGGAALLRLAAVHSAGGFPARYFLYYEDTDTSWRSRPAGGRIAYAPGVRAAPARQWQWQWLGGSPDHLRVRDTRS
ncbi:MAG: hypothetical protein ACJ73E_08455 [Mycobacteriales bacterium]